MRENPLLRAQIESISRRYPAEVLTVEEVGELLGRKKSYVYAHYKPLIKGGRVNKARLAAALLKE